MKNSIVFLVVLLCGLTVKAQADEKNRIDNVLAEWHLAAVDCIAFCR